MGKFHVKHRNIGYDSADFFCRTFPATASDRVKKVIKGYGNTVFPPCAAGGKCDAFSCGEGGPRSGG